jgi:hypothetical protein
MHTFLSSYLALPYTLSLANIGRLYLHREIRQRDMQGRWFLELGGLVVWSKRGQQQNNYGPLPLYLLYSNELHLSGF